jgi:hypothetical protein
MTITNAIEKLQKLDPEFALIRAIDQTNEQYEDLQRSQLAAGITKDGATIEPYPYSRAYAKKRQKAGLQIAHIDLKFTGEYYKNMTMNVDNNVIRLGSNVDYEGAISKRYDGAEIYGLTDENMAKYRAIVKPIIVADMKAQYNA